MDGHPTDAAHVAACAACQAREGLQGLDVDLDRVWLGVAATVWARRVGPVEAGLGRLLGSPGLARALLTTPSLLLSWVVASVAVLAVGAWATRTTGAPWVALLAPAVAGAGIAYAYGPGIDPAFELGRTMAVSDRLILLARGLAVFGLNALLGLAASLVSSDVGELTWRWLVPMTAVCALALAAATLAASANAGVAAALAGWALAVLAAKAETGAASRAVTADALIPVYLAVAAGAALAVYVTGAGRNEGAAWRRTSTLGG